MQVERHHRRRWGDRILVIEAAVLTGRTTMAPVAGVRIPARFRFVHRSGTD